MRKPLVSVVVSLYNKGELVRRAIESVLAQSFQDFEVVVVDDCSVDAGPDAVLRMGDPRIRLLKTEKNSGPSVARDIGVRASFSNFIAFLDADDEWKPTFLESCVRFLEAHPEAGLVATGYERWENRGRYFVVMNTSGGIIENPFVMWGDSFFVWASGILVRKEAYSQQVGLTPGSGVERMSISG